MSLKGEAMRALDTQLGLINYFKGDEGRLFMQNFIGDMYMAGADPEIQMMIGDERVKAMKKKFGPDHELVKQAMISGAQLAYNLSGALNTAQTFYVSDDMMTLNLKAGSNVPPTPFQYDDLPCDHGFVMLPRVLKTTDIHGLTMTARAFAWITSSVNHVSPMVPGGIEVPSVIIVYFCAKGDWREDGYLAKEHDEMPEYFLGMPEFQMTHWQPLGFGDDWARDSGVRMGDVDLPAGAPDEASARTMIEWSAFMKSFFLLVKQKIAVLEHHSLDRGRARRLSRSALMPEGGDVQVVTLRKERPTSDDEIADGTPIEWSHRWIVSGHWRNQYYPSKGLHEPVWIEAYEKGPENKPLVIKDKVFVWKR